MRSVPELASFYAIVHGRVQGVFFRDFVRRRATNLGLTGYVRNLPDGSSVEVWAEGKQERLEKLLQYLHQGPRGAWVEKVEVRWGEYRGDYPSFGVRF